jgi:hypothetical protein
LRPGHQRRRGAADGRFLMAKLDPDDYRITELVVVQNWFEELRRRENAGQ